MELHSKQKHLPILECYLKVIITLLLLAVFFKFLINFDFSALHIAHLNNITILPCLVLSFTGLMLCVFFLHFRQ